MFVPEDTVSLVTRCKDFTPEFERCVAMKDELALLCDLPIDVLRRPENLEKLPKSDRVAYALGLRYYSTGTPCKHGHTPLRELCSTRLTPEGRPKGRCRECSRTNERKEYGRKRNQRLVAEAAERRKIEEKALSHEAETFRQYIEYAYEQLWVECTDRNVWFPQTRGEAVKYDMPIFRKADGTLWRVASCGKTTPMHTYRAWKLQETYAQKEADRVKKFIPELNAMSAREIVEAGRLHELPVGTAAARLAKSRFSRAAEGPCVHGHPPIRKVTPNTSCCIFCSYTQKRAAHAKRLKEDEEYRARYNAKIRKDRRKNPGKYQKWEKSWRKNNPAKVKAKKIRARTALGQATPAWLTLEQWEEMDAVYFRAQRKTEETGILYHVDHIIPIRGEDVCGLHVPWNLRAIPAKLNHSKGNRPLEEYVS